MALLLTQGHSNQGHGCAESPAAPSLPPRKVSEQRAAPRGQWTLQSVRRLVDTMLQFGRTTLSLQADYNAATHNLWNQISAVLLAAGFPELDASAVLNKVDGAGKKHGRTEDGFSKWHWELTFTNEADSHLCLLQLSKEKARLEAELRKTQRALQDLRDKVGKWAGMRSDTDVADRVRQHHAQSSPNVGKRSASSQAGAREGACQ